MSESKERSKAEWEEMISKEYTLGSYQYDEEQNRFVGDVEIELALVRIGEHTYQSAASYFFDGYEVGVSEEAREALVFEGTEADAKQQAIAKYHQGMYFYDIPIVYPNISVEIVEE